MSKERLRKAIAQQTQEYLDAGGVIEQVPRVICCPPHMGWARRRGLDWSSWSHIGGLGFGDYIQDVVNLEEGCFMRKPCPFEGDKDG